MHCNLLHTPLFAMVLATASPLSAQLRWVDAAPAQSPAPRYGHAMSDRELLFGGRDGAQTFADTWAYAGTWASNPGWTPVATTTSPAARFDHAVATNLGGMLLFGGQDLAGNRSGDTWLLTGGWVSSPPPHTWSGQWQQLQPATAPSPRSGHAMAYDLMTMTECLLFGGRTDAGLSNETWLFTAGQWQLMTVTTAPPAREGHALQTTHDRWLLFGGEGTGGALSDVWQFDGVDWQQLDDMPFAATDTACIFVPGARRRHIFVGGADGSGTLRTEVHERRRDGSWLNQPNDGTMPARRDAAVTDWLHHMSSSSGGQFVHTPLVFGGRDAAGNALGDTWRLEPTHLARSEQLNDGCGPGAWGNTGPNLSGLRLLLGSTRDFSAYTLSPHTPVFVGFQFGAVANPGPCALGIESNVTLFGMTDHQMVMTMPLQVPFLVEFRGLALSAQAVALEPTAATGLSLSGVTVIYFGD